MFDRCRRALVPLVHVSPVLLLGLLAPQALASDDPAPTGPSSSALFVSLNGIPDDQNDLLVVPPGGFHITLGFEPDGDPPIDFSSLRVISERGFGRVPARTNLAGRFELAPDRTVAVWKVHPMPIWSDATTV